MKSPFLKAVVAKRLLAINGVLAIFYLISLLIFFQRGNIYLYVMLIAGEFYHIWQLITLIQAAWETRLNHPFDPSFMPPVDIYITIAGESAKVVEKTLRAASQIDYPDFHVYLLNDGYVAKKSNWQDIEELAKRYDPKKVTCITRRIAGGAKAGNINHAMTKTKAPFIAVLDCDHIPARYFLKRMAGYFIDPKLAFVQSPQYYKNHVNSFVANAAWQQQTLFFGPICRGKDRSNALFMCGTNMLIRRQALDDVGGMSTASITEDMLTSLLMHARGWRSVYEPHILARGLAPEDLGSFSSQQYRWARGSLEVLLKYNPLWLKGLSFRQRLQYLASVTYYLSGIIVLFDAVLPLVYFYSGQIPISSTTMAIALIFVPYIYLTLYSLQVISNFSFTFRAISFSISSWLIFIMAFVSAVLRLPSGFKVTSKERNSGTYFRLVWLHILYIIAIFVGVIVAYRREGINSSLITNISWGLIYVFMFGPFVRAALSERQAKKLPYDSLKLPIEDLSP